MQKPYQTDHLYTLLRPLLIIGLLSLVSPGCLARVPDPEFETTSISENLDQLTREAVSDPTLGDSRFRAKDGVEMVYVPPGKFEMGSDEQEVEYALEMCWTYDTNCSRGYFSIEQPLHMVELSSFWLDKTEGTAGQYDRCTEEGFCDPPTCEEDQQAGEGELPVVCVSWDQAVSYCQWTGARLPTEAEWEYAARGRDAKRYPWGSDFDGSKLNYCDANCELGKRDEGNDDGYAQSAPVGSYPGGASWVGALDMAGNVWEWTADWYGSYPTYQDIDPTGPPSGGRRVARGGSWHTSPDHTRSALRTYSEPGRSYDHMGFRCASSVSPGDLSP